MTGDIKDVEIRNATAEDIRLFYPDGSPRTVYAWLALYKGVPACLAGLIISRAGCVAFSEVKPGIDAPKRTIWITAKALLDRIEKLNMPMFAACDLTDKSAQKFVHRLGFKYERPLPDMELFRWVK